MNRRNHSTISSMKSANVFRERIATRISHPIEIRLEINIKERPQIVNLPWFQYFDISLLWYAFCEIFFFCCWMRWEKSWNILLGGFVSEAKKSSHMSTLYDADEMKIKHRENKEKKLSIILQFCLFSFEFLSRQLYEQPKWSLALLTLKIFCFIADWPIFHWDLYVDSNEFHCTGELEKLVTILVWRQKAYD